MEICSIQLVIRLRQTTSHSLGWRKSEDRQEQVLARMWEMGPSYIAGETIK